jgi:hypothetical protein
MALDLPQLRHPEATLGISRAFKFKQTCVGGEVPTFMFCFANSADIGGVRVVDLLTGWVDSLLRVICTHSREPLS